MSVTKEQLNEIAKQMFESVDTNKNGSLDIDEVRVFSTNMMKQFKPDAEFNEERFATNFAKLDKNGDGKVCFDELAKSMIEKATEAGVIA